MPSTTWNTTNGSWFNNLNWDEPNPNPPPPPIIHVVPTAAHDVSIPDNTLVGTPFTVSFNGTGFANTINGNLNVTLGITGGSLTLTNGGAFNSMAINVASGAALNINAGTLVVTAGNYAGTLAGAGTLVFTIGTFNLNAGVSVTVSDWVLGVSSNGTVSTTNLNTNLTYANNFTLGDLSGNHAVLNLNSNTLTLSGAAVLDGTMVGPGKVLITGTAQEGLTGNGQLNVNGGATLEYATGSSGTNHRSTFLGNATTTGTLKINTGATYTIDGNSSVGSTTATQAIVNNAGTFAVNGAGSITATLAAQFTNTGTLSAAADDTLWLNFGGNNTLGGTISGAGTLLLGSGTFALNSTNVTVGTLHINGGNGGATVTLGANLTYSNTFVYDGQFDTFSLNGNTLTLAGTSTLASGNLTGAGTLRNTGSAEIVAFSIGGPNGGGTAATLQNSGSIEQTGNVGLHGTILNDAGAFYSIMEVSSIADLGATFTNNGDLTSVAQGTNHIGGDLTNSATGEIMVVTGSTLSLNNGTHTLAGTLSGSGTLMFGFASAAGINTTNVTVGALTLAGGNGGAVVTLGVDLTYNGKLSFANQFDLLDLNGHTLTLSGTGSSLLGNNIDGAGTLRVTGSATIGGNVGIGTGGAATTALTVRNSGTMTQTGSINLNGTLLNDATRTYTISTAGNINNFGATITNNGIFADNAAGISEISGTFTNNGTLSVGAGATLILHSATTLGGTVSGAGALVLGASASTAINTANVTVATLSLEGGIFAGTTTLGTNLSYGGLFRLNSDFHTLAMNGHTLTLTGTTDFVGGKIAGLNGSADALVINGSNTNLAAISFQSWEAGDTITLNGTAGNDTLAGSALGDKINGATAPTPRVMRVRMPVSSFLCLPARHPEATRQGTSSRPSRT